LNYKNKILLIGFATIPVALEVGLNAMTPLRGGGGHIIKALLNDLTPLRGGGGHIIKALLNDLTPLRGGGGHIIKAPLE
jgi:hypothetical protein